MKTIKIIFSFFFLSVMINSFAQTDNFVPVTDNETKTFIKNKILSESKKTTSLQCNFVQEKKSTLFSEKAISKGIMLYKAPNALRWEYLSPNKIALILNENEVFFINESGEVSNSNKVLKQLGTLIISTINGEALNDTKKFKAEYFKDNKNNKLLLIKLTPVPTRLKDMFASIRIVIDTTDYLASKIMMEETSGDVTTITFSEKKVNIKISNEKFSAKK